jgi:hypothetical protein
MSTLHSNMRITVLIDSHSSDMQDERFTIRVNCGPAKPILDSSFTSPRKVFYHIGTRSPGNVNSLTFPIIKLDEAIMSPHRAFKLCATAIAASVSNTVDVGH